MILCVIKTLSSLALTLIDFVAIYCLKIRNCHFALVGVVVVRRYYYFSIIIGAVQPITPIRNSFVQFAELYLSTVHRFSQWHRLVSGASLVLHVPALRRRSTKVVRYIVKMYLAQH